MTDTKNIEWPREIWMAEREDYDQGVVSAVLSEWATVPRWNGDTERDREFHRYIDADIYDSAELYHNQRRENLLTKHNAATKLMQQAHAVMRPRRWPPFQRHPLSLADIPREAFGTLAPDRTVVPRRWTLVALLVLPVVHGPRKAKNLVAALCRAEFCVAPYRSRDNQFLHHAIPSACLYRSMIASSSAMSF